jgi:hypothetical protein
MHEKPDQLPVATQVLLHSVYAAVVDTQPHAKFLGATPPVTLVPSTLLQQFGNCLAPFFLQVAAFRQLNVTPTPSPATQQQQQQHTAVPDVPSHHNGSLSRRKCTR